MVLISKSRDLNIRVYAKTIGRSAQCNSLEFLVLPMSFSHFPSPHYLVSHSRHTHGLLLISCKKYKVFPMSFHLQSWVQHEPCHAFKAELVKYHRQTVYLSDDGRAHEEAFLDYRNILVRKNHGPEVTSDRRRVPRLYQGLVGGSEHSDVAARVAL